MPAKDLFAELKHLMTHSSTGAALFGDWISCARESFSSHGDDLDQLLPQALQEKLLKERDRVSARLGNFAPNSVKPRTRAVWLGLTQLATRKHYNVATYVSISQVTSEDDPEWESSAKKAANIFVEMPNLTQAHQKPADCSAVTANALYIILPLAMLGSAVLDIAKKKKMEKIEEYSFGWDAGDLLKWRP